MQQVEEATASGNNSVPPKVNLVEEAIEFASNINPENLPIQSYDANGTLIDVQWQGEANALDTLHDDPTFRNVVSQQDSILRFSTPMKPTEDDILFGRGGDINIHPGNVRFQAKALELRSWYEACNSKEEKYKVSELLVDCMKAENRRFLEKGPDGLWYKVLGNGIRKKASQAFKTQLESISRTPYSPESIARTCEADAAGGPSLLCVKDNGDFQVPTGVPAWPRSNAQHGNSSGNSSAFMSVLNESMGSFSIGSTSISLMEDFDTHLMSENMSSPDAAGGLSLRCIKDNNCPPTRNASTALIMQQVEEATASGNNSVSPKVNLVEEAIEFASNINPENLPIRSYDANGTLINVQWQGEANALETFNNDPTFRNVVSQQDSILRSGLTPSFSKLSTSFQNLGMISVPTNAAANEEKRKSKRVIDFSTPTEPTEDDILFGRGGNINKHPGNVRFREKARFLFPCYEACDSNAEKKCKVSEFLVDCMLKENRRFLEKGPDGLWYEVVGNHMRKKASQTLRECARF